MSVPYMFAKARNAAPLELRRFTSFGIVGLTGFAADAIVLYVLMNGFGAGAFSGRVVSISAAMLTTWLLNRIFTFAVKTRVTRTEIFRYIAVKCFGLAANLAIYTAIVFLTPRGQYPLMALIVASIASMVINYSMVKRFVFAPDRNS